MRLTLNAHGSFALTHTGPQPNFSSGCLLTTVAWRLGPKSQAAYALEGAAAGMIDWLR